MKLGLFIPAYRVQDSVISVLDAIPPELDAMLAHVWIIDNASDDQTAPRIEAWLRERRDPRYSLWRNESNHSLGGTTILALRMALEAGCDYLLNLHSDGQADPDDVLRIARACTPEPRLVLGSRFVGASRVADYQLSRKLGNWFFVVLQQLLLRRRVHDLGALAALPLGRVAALPFDRLPPDMGYPPMLVLELLLSDRSLPVTEIPIAWGEAVHTNVVLWRYGLSHLARLARRFAGLGSPLAPSAPPLPTRRLI
jgi:dolichol-phosphate mannosyltransferase